jgi:hypothetical protein
LNIEVPRGRTSPDADAEKNEIGRVKYFGWFGAPEAGRINGKRFV